MGKITTAGLGVVLFLGCCCGGAWAATAPPLLQLTVAGSSCATAFPAIPGQQVCVDLAFADNDLWVFRDGRALLVKAYESSGFASAQVPGTPLSAHIRQGTLPAAQMASLAAALLAARIGLAPGNCNPIPPLLDVPPSFPQPDLHFRIVWYGKGFRHNLVELGTQFSEPCPQPLVDLLAELLDKVFFSIQP
jgi:hypothetical protein